MIITTRIKGAPGDTFWYRLTDVDNGFTGELVGIKQNGRLVDESGHPITTSVRFDRLVSGFINLK